MGNGMYEELKRVPSYIYNGLFSIGGDSFRTNEKNGQLLQVIWKISKLSKEVSSNQRSFIYQEHKTQRRTASHAVFGSNRLSSFT